MTGKALSAEAVAPGIAIRETPQNGSQIVGNPD